MRLAAEGQADALLLAEGDDPAGPLGAQIANLPPLACTHRAPGKRVCGKDHLWTPAYYVGTAGSVSSALTGSSIMECQGK